MARIVQSIITGRGSQRVRTSTGVVVEGNAATAADWVRLRYQISVQELVHAGVAAEQARNASAMGCVLWAWETGYGERERRGNVSSIHCVSRQRCVLHGRR